MNDIIGNGKQQNQEKLCQDVEYVMLEQLKNMTIKFSLRLHKLYGNGSS